MSKIVLANMPVFLSYKEARQAIQGINFIHKIGLMPVMHVIVWPLFKATTYLRLLPMQVSECAANATDFANAFKWDSVYEVCLLFVTVSLTFLLPRKFKAAAYSEVCLTSKVLNGFKNFSCCRIRVLFLCEENRVHGSGGCQEILNELSSRLSGVAVVEQIALRQGNRDSSNRAMAIISIIRRPYD